eukprot:CAMPEP_0197872672 /NCGR_PEP_ID=MMETSP1439-20131203/2697_1 /TAXON_ID=66791 /ORGANISM="Gonyaulax spinifera, Strain CCMP409" /LENGTH=242 /DNA_ID=CAMNT_0043491677 /DNA_START=9 /DNA_END=735 /DNA_ORIENTATION=+
MAVVVSLGPGHASKLTASAMAPDEGPSGSQQRPPSQQESKGQGKEAALRRPPVLAETMLRNDAVALLLHKLHYAVERLVVHGLLAVVSALREVLGTDIPYGVLRAPVEEEHSIRAADGARPVLPPRAVHQSPLARTDGSRGEDRALHDAVRGQLHLFGRLGTVAVVEMQRVRAQFRLWLRLLVLGHGGGDHGAKTSAGRAALVAHKQERGDGRKADIAWLILPAFKQRPRVLLRVVLLRLLS